MNLLTYTFNAPRSIHKGFEATGDWQPLGDAAPGLRLRASYTWMNQVYDEYVERLSAGSFTQALRPGREQDSRRRRRTAVVARLGYDHLSGSLAGLGGHVEYTYRDAAWVDNANLLQAPGYTLTNLNVHYDGRQFKGVLKGVHLLFEVRNVANKVWVGVGRQSVQQPQPGHGTAERRPRAGHCRQHVRRRAAVDLHGRPGWILIGGRRTPGSRG